jgi:hypothetical protein
MPSAVTPPTTARAIVTKDSCCNKHGKRSKIEEISERGRMNDQFAREDVDLIDHFAGGLEECAHYHSPVASAVPPPTPMPTLTVTHPCTPIP